MGKMDVPGARAIRSSLEYATKLSVLLLGAAVSTLWGALTDLSSSPLVLAATPRAYPGPHSRCVLVAVIPHRWGSCPGARPPAQVNVPASPGATQSFGSRLSPGWLRARHSRTAAAPAIPERKHRS